MEADGVKQMRSVRIEVCSSMRVREDKCEYGEFGEGG